MSRNKRLMLMPGAAVVVTVSLAFGPVAASDEPSMESMEATESRAPMHDPEPGLQVMDAWVRESPMLDLAGAAYMVIHNDTDFDDALVGASSPAAEVVELHLSAMDDEGMMSMQPVTEIPIPAHGEAILEPGSYHVMLIDLVEPLTEGAEVEIGLEFMTAEPQTISAPVMAGGPMMGGMDMESDMDDGEHSMDDDTGGGDEDGDDMEEDS